MGRAGPMGQLIMDFTGPVLGWAWSTWARAGLGRELASPWRALLVMRRYTAGKWRKMPRQIMKKITNKEYCSVNSNGMRIKYDLLA